MKKVFSSHSEVCHVWANRTQSEGKANNIFFEDGIIYSYGKHFELAKFIEYNEKTYLFVNTYNYSVSTAKHRNHVRSAINKSLVDKVFYFDFINHNSYYHSTYSFNLTSIELKDVIEDLLIDAKNSFTDQLKARSNSYKYNLGMSSFENAKSLFFTFMDLFSLEQRAELIKNIHSFDGLILEARNKSEYLTNTREQRELAKKEAKAKKELERLQDWLNGSYNQPLYNLPIYLRLQGDYIQTSHGARVPKLEALKAFMRIKQGENIEGEKIGQFTVNLQSSKLIKIGCHNIKLDLVSPFLDSLV